MQRTIIALAMCLVFARSGQSDPIAVWNFNDAVLYTTGGVREFLVDRGIGSMFSTFAASDITNFAGTGLNSIEGDPAGRALGLAGSANNGGSLTWMVGTTGFENIVVSLAIQRSSTGFNNNQFLYTVDSGLAWVPFLPRFTPGAAYSVLAFDLSGIEFLDGNPGAGFRIVFDGATSASGNNRIDNLVVSGRTHAPPDTTPVPEPSTLALTIAGLALAISPRPMRLVKTHDILQSRTCAAGSAGLSQTSQNVLFPNRVQRAQ